MAPYRRARKFAKKAFSYAKKAAKKRYYKKGNLNMGKIIKDVKFLKSVINAEKKQFLITASSLTGAQLFGASGSGHYTVDCTPIPAQGTTDITRNGDSIKVCSAYIKFQFYEQANTTHPVRGKIMIFQVLGTPQTASTFTTNILKPDPMCSNSIYDLNSTFNTDYRGQYRPIATKYFKVVDNYSSQIAITDVTVKLRLNHHVRFNNNTTTVSDGQYIMIVVFDSGNSDPTNVATTTGVPITATATGLTWNYSFTWYYYDN